MALFVLNIFINRGRILEDYDEFTHWGVITKNMFMYNTYGTNPESVVRFNEYPPFTSIFQYFFLKIQNIYREDTIIIAQNVLYLSIIIPFTRVVSWKKNLNKLFVILPVIIFLPMIFYADFYLEILVDGMLGIMFAYLMFTAFEKQEDIKFKMLKIFAGLIMLCLTKTTGIALAIIGITIIIIKNIIDRKKEIKLIFLVLILTILFTSLWYIKVSSVDTKWNYEEFTNTAEQKINQRESLTANFFTSLFTNEKITTKNLTVFGVFLILVSLFLATKKVVKNENYNYYGLSYIFTTIIYLIGTWIIYITIFDLDEAVNLSSFDRYTSVILLSYLTFLANVLIEEERKTDIKTILGVISIILLLLPYTNISDKYINAKIHIDMANINREVYTKIKYQKDKLTLDDKVLILTTPKDNVKFLKPLEQYEMMPIKIEDVLAVSFRDLEDFKNLVKNYTHIYIYRIDEENKNIVKDVFEEGYVENDMLYRVVYEENQIKLEIER